VKRRSKPAAPGDQDENEDHDLQFAAIDIANAFHEHDMAALAHLDPAQRAEQARARRTLWLYVDAMWDSFKAAGLSPADLPQYDSVAALRDLAGELHSHATSAQADAGEDPDE